MTAVRRIERPCAEIPVLLVGPRSGQLRLRRLLADAGHPVVQATGWEAAIDCAAGVDVAIVLGPLAHNVTRADALRARQPRVRVILVPTMLSAELEEEIALREFVRLHVAGPDVNPLHELVHGILTPTPDPHPTALP